MYEGEYEFSGESPMKECYEEIARLINIMKVLERFAKKFSPSE